MMLRGAAQQGQPMHRSPPPHAPQRGGGLGSSKGGEGPQVCELSPQRGGGLGSSKGGEGPQVCELSPVAESWDILFIRRVCWEKNQKHKLLTAFKESQTEFALGH
jgi:hypothetical protein